MFGKGTTYNSIFWNKAKLRIKMFGKKQNLELECLEKAKFRI